MRWLIYALGVCAALAAALGGARADTPKQLNLRQDLLGWEAVGRVELSGSGYCTGVLIAADLVLTAAHCLTDREGMLRETADGLAFRAGLRDGESVAERAVLQAVVDPRYRPESTVSATNMRHDVALLKLAEPIPTAVAAPFLVADTDTAEVSVLSYAAGRDAALAHEASCQVLIREAGLMAFDCDVDFGSSGAPVFDSSGDRARIVSLISAGRRDGDISIAFGMELPERVAELKTELRSGRGLFELAVPEPRRMRPDVTRMQQSSDIGAKFLRP